MPAEEIDPRLPFESFAMDLIAALMVLGRLERHLGKKLSPTAMWNYPTSMRCPIGWKQVNKPKGDDVDR